MTPEERLDKLEADVERIVNALDQLSRIGALQQDHNKLMREAVTSLSTGIEALTDVLEAK